VNSAIDGGSEARCAVQGAFPDAAYYSAYYFIPEPTQNPQTPPPAGVWNLFHFQDPPPSTDYMWDLSLLTRSDGGPLQAVIYDFQSHLSSSDSTYFIPVGQWFHLEVYFKRAADNSGVLRLWIDGNLQPDLTGMPTDDTTANPRQWLVGNWANGLIPPVSTIYVDDVAIGLDP